MVAGWGGIVGFDGADEAGVVFRNVVVVSVYR